jgi:hypothetical protein
VPRVAAPGKPVEFAQPTVLTKGRRRGGNKGESGNGKCRSVVPSDPARSSCYHGVANMTPAQRRPNVVVLGGGSWGTTIASICARRGPTLQWVRAEATAKDINEITATGAISATMSC